MESKGTPEYFFFFTLWWHPPSFLVLSVGSASQLQQRGRYANQEGQLCPTGCSPDPVQVVRVRMTKITPPHAMRVAELASSVTDELLHPRCTKKHYH